MNNQKENSNTITALQNNNYEMQNFDENQTNNENSQLIFKCETCDRVFSKKSKLNRHIKETHQNLKTYTCEICNKSFKRNSHLKRHMISHSENPKPHKCDVEGCYMSFACKHHLDRHVKIIHGEERGNLKCNECNLTFTKKSGYNKHMNQVHQIKQEEKEENKHINNNNTNSNQKTQQEKNFKCEKCGKVFYKQSAFDKHMIKHQNKEYVDNNLQDLVKIKQNDSLFPFNVDFNIKLTQPLLINDIETKEEDQQIIQDNTNIVNNDPNHTHNHNHNFIDQHNVHNPQFENYQDVQIFNTEEDYNRQHSSKPFINDSLPLQQPTNQSINNNNIQRKKSSFAINDTHFYNNTYFDHPQHDQNQFTNQQITKQDSQEIRYHQNYNLPPQRHNTPPTNHYLYSNNNYQRINTPPPRHNSPQYYNYHQNNNNQHMKSNQQQQIQQQQQYPKPQQQYYNTPRTNRYLQQQQQYEQNQDIQQQQQPQQQHYQQQHPYYQNQQQQQQNYYQRQNSYSNEPIINQQQQNQEQENIQYVGNFQQFLLQQTYLKQKQQQQQKSLSPQKNYQQIQQNNNQYQPYQPHSQLQQQQHQQYPYQQIQPNNNLIQEKPHIAQHDTNNENLFKNFEEFEQNQNNNQESHNNMYSDSQYSQNKNNNIQLQQQNQNQNQQVINNEEIKLEENQDKLNIQKKKIKKNKKQKQLKVDTNNNNNNNNKQAKSNNPKMFVCSVQNCSKMYTKLSNLKVHIRAYHFKNRIFKCEMPGCESSFLHKKSLKEHMQKQHNQDIKNFDNKNKKAKNQQQDKENKQQEEQQNLENKQEENEIKIENHIKEFVQSPVKKRDRRYSIMSLTFETKEDYEDEIDQEYQLHLKLVELIKKDTKIDELSTQQWVEYWNAVANKKKFKFEYQNLEKYVQNLIAEKQREEQLNKQQQEEFKRLENLILDEEEDNFKDSPLKKRKYQNKEDELNEVYKIDKENHQHMQQYKENFKKNLGQFLQDKNYHLNDEKQNKISIMSSQANNNYSDQLQIQREQIKHEEEEQYYFLDNIENELKTSFPFKEDQILNENKKQTLIQQLKNQNNRVFDENEELDSNSNFSSDSDDNNENCINKNLVKNKRRSQTFNLLKQHNFQEDGIQDNDNENNKNSNQKDNLQDQKQNKENKKIRSKQKSSELQNKKNDKK